jgi:hypothetical protein
MLDWLTGLKLLREWNTAEDFLMLPAPATAMTW